jgi:aspartate/methionine/tyrosine aminotransferase
MAATLPESGIMAVINYGSEKAGVLPFWAGEGDAPTPAFIAEAAIEALRQGHTFYRTIRLKASIVLPPQVVMRLW